MAFSLLRKHMYSALLVFLLLCGKVGYGFNSGDDPILTRLTAFNKLMETHQPEKIHLHTNQPFYQAGDTIWFKSYILNSFYSRPSDLSKLMNIELISNNGKVIYRTKLRPQAGLAWGYVPLSDSVQAGTYHMRAYTPGMKNFGEAFYYDRSVRIRGNSEKQTAVMNADNSIQFFPEGGELVAGIRTKIAFKAIAPAGLGIPASGRVEDDKGELITEFKSEHLGMGVFAITAQSGRSYYANVRFGDGTEKRELIPLAKPLGYAMSVSSIGDSIRIRIASSPALKDKGNLTLIGSQDGISKYVSQFNVTQEIPNTVWVSRELFNTGTVQLTLFDPANNPVSERLVFVNNQDELLIGTSLKGLYKKNERVTFLLDLKNKAGQQEIGNLSVSVYNESELDGKEDDEISIFSDLLLTADLKGFVESPNYYFSNLKDENRGRHLDHLMLTQGWRKFSWKNTLSKNFPQIKESEEQGIELAGKMTLPSGKPFASGEISLFRAGLPPMVWQTITDDKGRFKFSDLNLIDTGHLVVSANNVNFRKNIKIDLFTSENSDIPVTRFPELLVPYQAKGIPANARLNELLNRNNGILLNSVTIQARKIKKVVESANLNGPGRADVILDADDIGNRHDLAAFLTSRVSGLRLYDGKVYSRDTPDKSMTEAPQPMLVVLDGINISQENFDVGSINADGIETVEVLKGAATTGLYGIEGSYGVLVITTKKGTDRSGNFLSSRTPGLRAISLTGYQSSREFYSPRYDLPGTTFPDGADLRKAVYWNPNVVTGLSGQTKLDYFNSDYSGTHKVVIEGINAEGQIGRAVFRYEVK